MQMIRKSAAATRRPPSTRSRIGRVSRTWFAALASCVALAGCVALPAAATAAAVPPTRAIDYDPLRIDADAPVRVLDREVVDASRSRTLPIRLYLPDKGLDPRPVVLFSHGLGGSREAAGFLGQHLASWGYVAVHIQHPGSDESVWAGLTSRAEAIAALKEAVKDVRVSIDRFKDVPFAVDRLEEMNAPGGALAVQGAALQGGHRLFAEQADGPRQP
jgi:predicted dienelactone hydrolase